LDRYEIDAELGRGAMGVVYRARDPKLGRTVAIKTVSVAGLEAEAEREYRRRFVVEAQAAGRLSHPGIVTIFDVNEEAEPYLVMEYVEGQSLQQLVTREKRALPISTTLRLIQEIAEALHYAHAQGVVHRDIKPANILVTTDGHPKIADFGIAKLNEMDLTLPGRVLGSPAFMAPEQLGDEAVDSRSDLFSLGVILYYMLTGHRPFQGNSTTTVCFKLVNHEPLPVSALQSTLPRELDAIVSRAIAKDPAQRYQTGLAMASDLQALRERSGFVHSSPEEAEGSGTGRAISRHSGPLGAEAQSLRLRAPDSGRTAGGDRSFRTDALKFSKAILVFGLLAAAIVGVAFWNTHGHKPKLSGPIDTGEGIVNKINKDDTPDGKEDKVSRKEKVPVKSAEPGSNISSSRPTASVPPVNATVGKNAADATLQIDIEHHFTQALASVWVDNRLVYTQALRGDKQRHALLFRKVAGHQFNVMGVTPGRHQLRVRIQSAADSYDQSKVVAIAFMQGVSLLRIVCGDRGEGLQVSLQKEAYQSYQ
jgi:serine/threonine protein kinase